MASFGWSMLAKVYIQHFISLTLFDRASPDLGVDRWIASWGIECEQLWVEFVTVDFSMTQSLFVIMTKQKPKQKSFLNPSRGVNETKTRVEGTFIVSCGTFQVGVVDREKQIIVWVIWIVYVTCILSFIECSYVENIGQVIHTPKTSPRRFIVIVESTFKLSLLSLMS